MGSAQRTKGHNWEREVAIRLRDLWPNAKRGIQTRDGGEALDVEGTPFAVECKVGARPNIQAAIDQAIATGDKRPPVVISKKDRHVPLVTMLLDDWLVLAKGAQNEDDDAF